MKILITGAGGMVARATVNQCRSVGDDVHSYDKAELDIADREKVGAIVGEVGPDYILNCAAYTDVDGCESNRGLCRNVNALGVENLAKAAKEHGCGLLTISTDYVFDGAKSGFYTQRDTPNPISFYGETKLEGEFLARKALARTIIVRTGWVFGRTGTNFLSVMPKLLSEGNSIKAIADAFGTPTYADHLAVRMRELIELDLPLIFHVSNSGDAVSFYQFGKAICRISDIDPSLVDKVSQGNLNRPAARPVNSGLRCLFSEKLGLEPMSSWDEALREFIAIEKTQTLKKSSA